MEETNLIDKQNQVQTLLNLWSPKEKGKKTKHNDNPPTEIKKIIESTKTSSNPIGGKKAERKKKFCSRTSELIERIRLLVRSCGSGTTELQLLLEEYQYNNNEFCSHTSEHTSSSYNEFCSHTSELAKYFVLDWLNLLRNEDYLKILCLLSEGNVCYISELNKIFQFDYKLAQFYLRHLEKLQIVKRIPKETYKDEVEIQSLLAHKQAFHLSQYHFNQAIFYKLTDMGQAFTSGIAFDRLLSKATFCRISEHKRILTRTHKQLEQQTVAQDDQKERYYAEFLNKRTGHSYRENLDWIGKRAERVAMDSEDLLVEFENRTKRKNKGK